MSQHEWDSIDPARSKLRTLTEHVQQKIAQIEAKVAGTPLVAEADGLMLAWQELVTALALGRAPELRACPHCGRGVLREATRCRYCLRTSSKEIASR